MEFTMNADTLIGTVLDEARRLFIHPNDPRYEVKAQRFKDNIIPKWSLKTASPSKNLMDQARAKTIIDLGYHLLNKSGSTEELLGELNRHLHKHATKLIKTAQKRLKKAKGGYIPHSGGLDKEELSNADKLERESKLHDVNDHGRSGALPTIAGEIQATANNYARSGMSSHQMVTGVKSFTLALFKAVHKGNGFDAKDHPPVETTIKMSKLLK